MQLDIHRLAAFTAEPSGGNPAGVVLLDDWLSDQQMQAVAAEVGLSETAFLVRTADGYHVRWFTPASEVPLCGHATLASGYYLQNTIGESYWPVKLQSASGPLLVSSDSGGFVLDFPADPPVPTAVPEGLSAALGVEICKHFSASNFTLALVDDEDTLARLQPDFVRLARLVDYGIIVSSRGRAVDFVSRMSAPSLGIDEDPVTGSAHCVLAPYWGGKLQTTRLRARQLSARGGDLVCELRGDRVLLTGQVVEIERGPVTVPD